MYPMNYSDILKSESYSFLQSDEHLGRYIILPGLAGSYSYGTNNENSDIDVRGNGHTAPFLQSQHDRSDRTESGTLSVSASARTGTDRQRTPVSVQTRHPFVWRLRGRTATAHVG